MAKKRRRVTQPENRSPIKGSKGFIQKGYRHFSCKNYKLVSSKYPFLKPGQIQSRVRKLWNQLSKEKRAEYGHSPEKIRTPSPTKISIRKRLSPDIYEISPSKPHNAATGSKQSSHKRPLKTSWQTYLNTSHKDPEMTSPTNLLVDNQHSSILVRQNEDKPKSSKNKKQVTFQLFPKKNLFQTTGAPSEISQGLHPKENDSSKDLQEALQQSKRNLFQTTEPSSETSQGLHPKEKENAVLLQSQENETSGVSSHEMESDPSITSLIDLLKDYDRCEMPETVTQTDVVTENSLVKTNQATEGILEKEKVPMICNETGEFVVANQSFTEAPAKDQDNLVTESLLQDNIASKISPNISTNMDCTNGSNQSSACCHDDPGVGCAESSSRQVTPGVPSIDDESRIVAQILAELGIMIAQEISPRSNHKNIVSIVPDELTPASEEVTKNTGVEPDKESEASAELSSIGRAEIGGSYTTGKDQPTKGSGDVNDMVQNDEGADCVMDKDLNNNCSILENQLPEKGDQKGGETDSRGYSEDTIKEQVNDGTHIKQSINGQGQTSTLLPLSHNLSSIEDTPGTKQCGGIAKSKDSCKEDNVLLISPPRKRGRPRKCKRPRRSADVHPEGSVCRSLDLDSETINSSSTETGQGVDGTSSNGKVKETISLQKPCRKSRRLNPEIDGAESPGVSEQTKQLPHNLRRSPRLGQLQSPPNQEQAQGSSPNLRRSPRLALLQNTVNMNKSPPPKISPKPSPKKKVASRVKSAAELTKNPTQDETPEKFAESKYKVYDFDSEDETDKSPTKFVSPKPRISPTIGFCIVSRCNDSEDAEGSNDLDGSTQMSPSPRWIDSTAMRLIAKGKLTNKDQQKLKEQKKKSQKCKSRKMPKHSTPTKRKRKSRPVPIKFVKKSKQDMFRKKAAKSVKLARKNNKKKEDAKNASNRPNTKDDAHVEPNEEEELMQAILGMGLDFDEQLIPDCLQDNGILDGVDEELDGFEEDDNLLPVSMINDSCDNWMYYDHGNPELDSTDDEDFLIVRRRSRGSRSPFSASQNLCKRFTEFCANLSQESSSQGTELSSQGTELSSQLTDLSQDLSSQMTDMDCEENLSVSNSPMYTSDDSTAESFKVAIPNADDIHTSGDEPCSTESTSLGFTGSAVTAAINCLSQQDGMISEMVEDDLENNVPQPGTEHRRKEESVTKAAGDELSDIIEEALKLSGISSEDASTDYDHDPSQLVGTENEQERVAMMENENKKVISDNDSHITTDQPDVDTYEPVHYNVQSKTPIIEKDVMNKETDKQHVETGTTETREMNSDSLPSQYPIIDQDSIIEKSDKEVPFESKSHQEPDMPVEDSSFQTKSPGPTPHASTEEENRDISDQDNSSNSKSHRIDEDDNEDKGNPFASESHKIDEDSICNSNQNGENFLAKENDDLICSSKFPIVRATPSRSTTSDNGFPVQSKFPGPTITNPSTEEENKHGSDQDNPSKSHKETDMSDEVDAPIQTKSSGQDYPSNTHQIDEDNHQIEENPLAKESEDLFCGKKFPEVRVTPSRSTTSDVDASSQSKSPVPSTSPPTEEEINDISDKDQDNPSKTHPIDEDHHQNAENPLATRENDDLFCSSKFPDVGATPSRSTEPVAADKDDMDNFLCDMFHQVSPSPPKVNHLPTPRISGRRLLASNQEQTVRNFSQLFEDDDIFL